jgi:primosomal protein N' (replication factor Y)
VLLIVPDERDIRILQRIFTTHKVAVLVISGELKKSERFLHFLRLGRGDFNITISTRSSVLAPLPENTSIMILDENDPSHFERRSPSWNTREVALTRSNEHSTIFISVTPSLEILSLAERNEISYYSAARTPSARITYSREDEDRAFFPVVTRSLKRGPVLVRSATSGYVQSFACQKCRNIAYCECGGKLSITSSSSDPICSLCERKYLAWSCEFCGEKRPRITRAGVERLADEYARSFPNIPVHFSNADRPMDIAPTDPSLIFSTNGVEPHGRYEALVLLDLEISLMQTSLRASELMRLEAFRLLSMLKPDGELFISLPQSHSFAQDLTKRQVRSAGQRELLERDSAHLPPRFRLIIIDSLETVPVTNALVDLVESAVVELIGPIARKGSRRLILKVPIQSSTQVVSRLVEINRVLSMRKAPLMRYYLDPYDLEL